MKIKKIYSCILILLIAFLALSNLNISNASKTYTQSLKTGINQFPKSYQERLKILADKYPNWKFQAYNTGVSWDELIEMERDESIHRNRITVNAPMSWKNDCEYVDNGWACASDGIVKYYLDPRNFLNETQIFQFVESSYNEKVQTLEAIKNSVKGTFLEDTITCKDLNGNTVTMSYSEMIIKAAKESNISAFYIKSKIIQEVGNDGSGSVSGEYPGYEGYYNFYNFGAYDEGNPIANGLEYAKERQWDSPYKAIVDGAKLIGKNYIEQGQNTAYFNKWDVVGTKILKDGETQTVSSSNMFWHQYMTNVQDPTSQSYSNYKLYKNSLNSEITFIIPVYNNMPDSNPMPQDIEVQSISMNQSKFVVNINERDTIKVTFNPSNATNKNLIWTSSNPDVVRVWEGDFRGLKEGSSFITAKTQDGSKRASCTVYVRNPNKKYVSDIKIEKSIYVVNINEAIDINFSYNPTDAANTTFEWSTSDDSIIRVWGPRFRALKEGVTKLIVATEDGTVQSESTVYVRDPNKKYVTDIKIEKSQYIIKTDEAVDVNFSYLPINSANAEFEWSSSDPDILRVWGPRFRGLKEGIAEIVAKTKDGTVVTRSKVIVQDSNKQYVTDINVPKTEYNIEIDQAVDMTPVTIIPENACNADIEWSSSNPDILRVWGSRFRGLKKGTADVIVRTKDGTVEKRIKVSVFEKGKLQDVAFKYNEYTIDINDAIDITDYTYTPSNATNAEFEWSSSNPDILRVWGPRFRGLKKGTADVIVRTKDKSFEKRIKVTINDPGKVQDINFEQNQYTIDIEQAIDITGYTCIPAKATNAEFEWSSSDPDILRVWGPRFRGLKEGTAEVIVKTKDGEFEKRIKVIVRYTSKKYVETIQLNKKEYKIKIDEVVDNIPYAYFPTNSVNAEFEWISSDPEIVRIWGNRFRGLKEGIAEVIVKTKDGTVENRIKVTVEK